MGRDVSSQSGICDECVIQKGRPRISYSASAEYSACLVHELCVNENQFRRIGEVRGKFAANPHIAA
jgi:hypothetical protein